MTPEDVSEEQAVAIAAVLATADGGCYVCAENLAEEMQKVFPAHDWATLVEEYR